MSIPITRDRVSAEEEARIRDRVRAVTGMKGVNGLSRVVGPEDQDALFNFFSEPAVSDPIYTIEKPVTLESVARHIARKTEAQSRGEGILTAVFDENGQFVSYMDHLIWPEWSAVEFGGAVRPELQSKGQGRSGIFSSINWVFEDLGLNLLCFTAAPSNHRSVKLIDAMGMRRMGEVTSTGPDGRTRHSLVWEITASEWRDALRTIRPD